MADTITAQTFTGSVVDVDTNNPLPGCTITDGGNPANTQEADGSGNFQITIADSSKGLLFSFAGYNAQSVFPSNNSALGTIYMGSISGGLVTKIMASAKNNPLKWVAILLVLGVIGFIVIKKKLYK